MRTTTFTFKVFLLLGLSFAFFSYDLPSGWFKAGSEPKSYDMGVDKGTGHDGGNAATIQSRKDKINGFGTLMQNCLPDKFKGKKVRMSGYMKSKDVQDWAGFWFRVDQAGSDQSLAFDNMHDVGKDRSIKGTTDWQYYEIVLYVPANASYLAYGALLVGTGQIWFDDIKFEPVPDTVPVTGECKEMRTEPVNLDFEK